MLRDLLTKSVINVSNSEDSQQVITFSDGSVLTCLVYKFEKGAVDVSKKESLEELAQKLTRKYGKSCQFIQAIKEFRIIARVDLKTAKETMDAFWWKYQRVLYKETGEECYNHPHKR